MAIPFTDREMERAWLDNLLASYNSQRTNAHRLLLFYAVECGLKFVLMRRRKIKRSDLCAEIAEYQHDINMLLRYLSSNTNLRLPEQIGNYIHKLGKAAGADYVLIDLGSGLNKISSPILLDARFQRFLITTINEPSVAGTTLCLSQMKKVAPAKTSVNDKKYYDPSVIISMLTPELIASPAYDEVLTRLNYAYRQSEQENNSTMLEIAKNYFAPELLYIDNWEEARLKLASTSIMEIATTWANKQVEFNKIILENLDPVLVEKLQVRATSKGRSLLEEVKVIVEEAIQYENTPAPQ
ncbi:hypothetical protein CAL7716_013890 [Calothrix sp. PCC 7716]|nr:hypothetical protein CAL7716_013890 [Calothrix sp. PCC 7716]